jgi:hypothetical protein
MRTTFIITTTLIGIMVAYGYPFVAILRGKRVLRTIGIGWALVFLGMLTICLLLPMLVSVFNKDFAKEMLNSWVPELPAVVAVAVMGWVPPLVAVAIGMIVKSLLNRFWPATSKRIESIGRKNDHVAS